MTSKIETIKVGRNQGFHIRYDTTNQDGIQATITKYFEAQPMREELTEIRKEAERQFRLYFGVKE